MIFIFIFFRPSTNTSFCTESKECLEYELVCKTDEYEVSKLLYLYIKMVRLSLDHLCVCVCVQVRHYSPTRWVSTDAEAYFMGVGAAMAFRRLFQYITGANEGGDALTNTFWGEKNSNRPVFLIVYVCVQAFRWR